MIPKKLKLGAFTFTVKTDATALLKESERLASNLYGATNYQNLQIVVHPDVAPMQMKDTLLHEVLHTCFHDYPELSNEDEESMIRFVTPRLLDALRSNPRFVEFLTEAA